MSAHPLPPANVPFAANPQLLATNRVPAPPRRDSITQQPRPTVDYSLFMEQIKPHSAHAESLSPQHSPAQHSSSESVATNDPSIVGGLIGAPTSTVDEGPDSSAARTVRFASPSTGSKSPLVPALTLNPVESFSVTFPQNPVAASPHPLPPNDILPQSILKAPTSPLTAPESQLDHLQLYDYNYSDSGSEGLSSYDDSDDGSVSEDSSSDVDNSGNEDGPTNETTIRSERDRLQQGPPRRSKKSTGYAMRHLQSISDDERIGESEIDLTEEEPATPITVSPTAPVLPKIGMENATVEDYEDMDGLLDTLNRYIKKNRYSRSLNPVASNPLAALKDVKTNAAPSWALEASNTLIRDPRSKQQSNLGGVVEETGSTHQEKVSMLIAKLTEANVKKITTRIYIEDARSFKTLLLTSLMSADQIIYDVTTKFHLEESSDWTIFELCNDLGIERPLRDWEIVTDVISAWDTSTSINAIVMKKYGYKATVAPKSIVGKYPGVQGWVYMETKPGKWQRRFFVLRDAGIYFYKDSNQSGSESLFCGLANFDVYTLSQRKKKAPTEFCFALRSTNSISYFENKQDYVRYLCVEKQERLYDWVLAIRLAKSEKTFADFPELFEDYPEISSKAWKRRQPDYIPSSKREKKTDALRKDIFAEPLLTDLKVDSRSPMSPERTRVTKESTSGASRSKSSRSHSNKVKPASSTRRAPPVVTDSDEEEPLLVQQLRHQSEKRLDEARSPTASRDNGLVRRASTSARRVVQKDEMATYSERESEQQRRYRSHRQSDSRDEYSNDREIRHRRATTTEDTGRRSPTAGKKLLSFNEDRRDNHKDRERDRERERERDEREYQLEKELRRLKREKEKLEKERHRERRREEGGASRSRTHTSGSGTLLQRISTEGSGGSGRSREDRPHRMSTRSKEGHSSHSESSRRRLTEDTTPLASSGVKLSRSKSKSENSGSKTLIDISDSPNCRTCGCSEARPSGRANGACANCYHVHKHSV
ncbi:hypothetical protein DFS34DRAFT_516615 [Phlyctochytrium arcticum]|nr:hypothetical protein DFS34DRAFT_516615 [Phlyctochytrium arcticum]